MARYQNIMIQIVSDSNLNSKEDLIHLLKDTTAANTLGGFFFATLVVLRIIIILIIYKTYSFAQVLNFQSVNFSCKSLEYMYLSV